jgi:hypothetical protein
MKSGPDFWRRFPGVKSLVLRVANATELPVENAAQWRPLKFSVVFAWKQARLPAYWIKFCLFVAW